MRPVFVGGTGRSGTTILAKVIGAHAAFYTFPFELRFHTDPDGLMSLRDALVQHWSPFHADVALHRFHLLMRSLKTPYVGRYPTTNLGRVFGRAHYARAVTRYIDAIEEFSYRGAWAGRTNILEKGLLRVFPGMKAWRRSPLRRMHYAGPMDHDVFMRLTRDFVADLAQPVLDRSQRQRPVEHTPGNSIHADFLVELFPEARILHIARDPLDVASSMRSRDWGPQDPEQASRIIADGGRRWEAVRARLPRESWLELQFEDLVRRRDEVIGRICAFLGVEVDRSMFDVDLSRHNIGRSRRDGETARSPKRR